MSWLQGQGAHITTVSWFHYHNNIVLFYHDSPITRSHFMDPTDHAIKWFYCIKNNAWVTMNNDLLSRVRRFGNDFIITESPHQWQKIVIHGNEYIILFLTSYFISWAHNSPKNSNWSLISPLSLRRVFSDLALTDRDITRIDLWHHANVEYWYCDAIFVNCSCTCKFAQRGSSLVNNNREYQFLTTRYSWLSV